MENKTINAFISHIHEEEEDIPKLKDLTEKHGITIKNYSITSDKFNNAKNENYIKTQILGPHIRQCSVLITHIAPETKDSKWVDWEIEQAHKQGKRIVGVWKRGERNCELPEALDKYADAIVGWNGESITDAITGASNNWYKQDGSPFEKESAVASGWPSLTAGIRREDEQVTSPTPVELAEALQELSEVAEEVEEDGLEMPSEEAFANARRLLEAMYRISPRRYVVYPEPGGYIAIDARGANDGIVVVMCDSDGGVLCLVTINDEPRRARYSTARQLPDGFIREALRDLGADPA